MGSEEAGQTNAIWYTLIESCRRRKIDPWKYLVWIFEELPKVKVTAETFARHTPAAYAKELRPRHQAKRTALGRTLTLRRPGSNLKPAPTSP